MEDYNIEEYTEVFERDSLKCKGLECITYLDMAHTPVNLNEPEVFITGYYLDGNFHRITGPARRRTCQGDGGSDDLVFYLKGEQVSSEEMVRYWEIPFKDLPKYINDSPFDCIVKARLNGAVLEGEPYGPK